VFETPTQEIGLGTYSLTGEAGVESIVTALDVGYRHVDTARMYENEDVVGDALERSDVDRDDVLVATKVGHFVEPEKTPSYIRTAIPESLDRLGVDTIDLLYHHWPRRSEEIETVLPVFEEFVTEGTVENVGVSNYTVDDLDRARDLVDVPIRANQVEMHPLLPQEEMRSSLRETDTVLVAYSPLAQGAVFDVPEIVAVAEKHGVSPATVSLAWLLSKDGVVPIPRSSSDVHIRSNFRALDLELDEEDIERIDAIETRHRCEDPDWMEW
jgi:2,5-diketo-D-gluconate reductase B